MMFQLEKLSNGLLSIKSGIIIILPINIPKNHLFSLIFSLVVSMPNSAISAEELLPKLISALNKENVKSEIIQHDHQRLDCYKDYNQIASYNDIAIDPTIQLDKGLKLFNGIVEFHEPIIYVKKDPISSKSGRLIGVYDSTKNEVKAILVSCSESTVSVKANDLVKNEPKFIFIAPDDTLGEDSTLEIFRYNKKSGKYESFFKIGIYHRVMSDGPDGSFDYTQTSEATAGKVLPDGRHELVVTTVQKNNGNSGSKEFDKKTETYGWKDDRLILVEEVTDGKVVFGRNDPIGEINDLEDDNSPQSWIRLIELMDQSNPNIQEKVRAELRKRIYTKEPLPAGVLSAFVKSYVAAKSKTVKSDIGTLMQESIEKKLGILSPEDRKNLHSVISPTAPHELKLLLALADDYDVFVFKALVQELDYDLKNKIACNAGDALDGISKIIKTTPKPSIEDVAVLKRAGQSKLYCSDYILLDKANAILVSAGLPTGLIDKVGDKDAEKQSTKLLKEMQDARKTEAAGYPDKDYNKKIYTILCKHLDQKGIKTSLTAALDEQAKLLISDWEEYNQDCVQGPPDWRVNCTLPK